METLLEVVRGVSGPGSDWGGTPSTSSGPPSPSPLPQFQDPASSENRVIACFGNLGAEFSKLALAEGRQFSASARFLWTSVRFSPALSIDLGLFWRV